MGNTSGASFPGRELALADGVYFGSVRISGEDMNPDICVWHYFAKRQSARAVD